MRIPQIPNAPAYAGLYVYDFSTHVSVGYTGAEIRILRQSEVHGQGTAYQIYRADLEGTVELRGALDAGLTVREAICFLQASASLAREDYYSLCRLAENDPVPCAAEVHLAKLGGFFPEHVTAILYPASASAVLSGWVTRHSFQGEEEVLAGTDVCENFITADGDRVQSCRLAAVMRYEDRSAEEVLASVDRPIQR